MTNTVKNYYEYLACRSLSVSEHMSKSGDDVDSEANQESPDSRIDWTKERKDNGQKPYWYDNGQSC